MIIRRIHGDRQPNGKVNVEREVLHLTAGECVLMLRMLDAFRPKNREQEEYILPLKAKLMPSVDVSFRQLDLAALSSAVTLGLIEIWDELPRREQIKAMEMRSQLSWHCTPYLNSLAVKREREDHGNQR